MAESETTTDDRWDVVFGIIFAVGGVFLLLQLADFWAHYGMKTKIFTTLLILPAALGVWWIGYDVATQDNASGTSAEPVAAQHAER